MLLIFVLATAKCFYFSGLVLVHLAANAFSKFMPAEQNNFLIFSKAIIIESHSLAAVISSLSTVCAVFMGVNGRGRYLVLANFCVASCGENEASSMGERGKGSTGCETRSALRRSQGCITGRWRGKHRCARDAARGWALRRGRFSCGLCWALREAAFWFPSWPQQHERSGSHWLRSGAPPPCLAQSWEVLEAFSSSFLPSGGRVSPPAPGALGARSLVSGRQLPHF